MLPEDGIPQEGTLGRVGAYPIGVPCHTVPVTRKVSPIRRSDFDDVDELRVSGIL